MASDIKATWWIADGIDGKVENQGAQALLDLVTWGDVDREILRHILESPFLVSVEPPDTWALHELSYFAGNERDYFEQVFSHPSIERGITDSTAKVIGALYVLDVERDTQPLDHNQLFMDERIINLPVSGETWLAIIRMGQPPAGMTITRLEEALRTLDSILSLPLPTNNILLLVSDRTYGYEGDFGGLNYGGQMVILKSLDTEATAIYGPSGYITHEAAHYFFYNGPTWIVEGFAGGVERIAHSMITGAPLNLSADPHLGTCLDIETFEQLRKARLDTNDDDDAIVSTRDGYGSEGSHSLNHCSFQYGRRVFVELYLELGPDAFREGLHHLYPKTVAFSSEPPPTVADVIEAFGPKARAILGVKTTAGDE